MAGSVMANAEGVNPSRHEIELQLERMLAHPHVRAKKLQSEILGFLVGSALEGKKVTELTLFEEFYSVDQFNAGDTHVRAMVNNTRRLLKEYYEGDGKDDSVIIALPAPKRSSKRKKHYKIEKRPAGEAYRPQFSYNPRAPIAKQLEIANHLLIGNPAQIERSLWRLDAISKAQPNHPDVILAIAEAVGSQLLIGGIYSEDLRAHFVAGGLLWIDKLDRSTADAWRIHNVRGLLHFVGGEIDKAKKEFAKALKLDRAATIGRGWYTQFLFAAGEKEEALQLTALLADENASNAHAQAFWGIRLGNEKRYGEAESAFRQALELDRNCWAAHYGMAQLCQAAGNLEKANEHIKRLEALVEPAVYLRLEKKLRPRGTNIAREGRLR